MKYLSKLISPVLMVFSCFSVGLCAQMSDLGLSEEVYQVQLKAYQASTSFHMYTLLEGDRQSGEDISSAVTQVQQQLDAWKTDGLTSSKQALNDSSARFLQLVQANEIADEGYTSHYTVNDMEAALKAFFVDLNALQPVGVEMSLQSDVLESAVLIRKIGSRYARLAAHWNGRGGILADPVGDTIDVHARAVAKQLDAIIARNDLPPKVQVVLQQVVKKWQYISPKLMDYNRDTVPYIVTRYSSSIVKQLLSVL